MLKNFRVLSLTTPLKSKRVFLSIILISSLNAETLDDALDGFEDEPLSTKVEVVSTEAEDDLLDGFDDEPKASQSAGDKAVDGSTLHPDPVIKSEKHAFLNGFTGKITEQVAFAANDDAPHDNINSLKTSLLLDYEHKFENGFRLKTNAKAYYDAIYDIRGKEKYSADELSELQSEVELFDAYVEGSINSNLDMKLGRQVVVWGRSDTIRVTDVLNPLDNRRPGMVDIEDLRLPVAMAKFDYFIDDWRITPMAVLEQRFSKNPPFGSAFNPSPIVSPSDEDYRDVLPALSIGGEFSNWDVNFYAAQLRDDTGYISNGKIKHDKTNMFGTAVNLLNGSWLFKSELAHFDGLKYTSTPNKEFKRTDMLLGTEYQGIADTSISYDVALRKVHDYDAVLKNESLSVKEHTYQHALRVTSDFMNATLKGNYLISLFGSKMDEGGFQRAWVKYDIADGIFANVGYVDYMGGSTRFDAVEDNDMAFLDLTYSF